MNRTSSLIRRLCVLLLAGAFVACGSDEPLGNDDDDEGDDPIATVTITPASDSLDIEESITLTATVRTQGGEDVTDSTAITWTVQSATKEWVKPCPSHVVSGGAADVIAVTGVCEDGATATVIGLAAGAAEIRATVGEVTGSATITVNPNPPVITTTSLADGEVGVAYDDTLTATEGDGTYAWAVTAGDLPDGLALNASTGEISGTPTAASTFDFTVEVTSAGKADTTELSITIRSDEVETSVAVVNVDFMSSVDPQFNDTVYVGQGVLSPVDTAYWNPADSFTGVTDAADMFGTATSVDLIVDVSGGTFIGAAGNELQDNGISSVGIPEQGFRWEGLVADSAYDLAFYIYAEVSLSASTSFDVTHAGGKTSLGPNDEPTWILPGEANKDYILLEDVVPYEISPGVYGFLIDNINEVGVIMGVQLKGPVMRP